MNDVQVRDIVIGKGRPLALISGPCVLEKLDEALFIAETLAAETAKRGIPYIFKASYEKDNRGSAKSYNGPGLHDGLEMLNKVREKIGCPVLSDIHRETDIPAAAQVLDVLQIPAFLCQQTSLILEAGKTGKAINVKKGQFLAPEDMASAVSKLHEMGNDNVLLTERGTCFGYHRLVSDLRCIPIMQSLGCPVVYDPTHIVRIYGLPSSDPAGGEPEFALHLARAGVAAGANALFIETHPSPFKAACDAASMVCLGDELPLLLDQVLPIAAAVRAQGLA
ncbi:MAG TPA: 3-deoxy-8-phosphooctulonate synthase [bacterium]|nr:3-deoxy-8-phosphooctulonate synthase [bacterium]